MGEQEVYNRWLRRGLLVLLLVIGLVSLDRALRARFDFRHFYLDARYVWEHQALNPDLDGPDPDQRRQLPFYLPAVPLLLAPLTAWGGSPAAIVWAAGQVAALGYALSILRRWCADGSAPGGAAAAFALTVLLAIPAFVEAGKFNQLSYFVLALVLGAVSALERSRPWAAGVLFGTATALKLLPGIFLLWLLVKRRWAAAAALLATAALLAVVPCLIVFGPARTRDYHRQWWDYNMGGQSARGLLDVDLAEHFIDRRNQSIPQVLARLTWPAHPYAAGWQIAQLDPPTCARVAYTISGVLLATLLWLTRRAWPCLSDMRRRSEAAAYGLGMLVFSPLLRQYYLVWAVPAVALLAHAALTAGANHERRLGRIGLGIWVTGMIAWMFPPARVLGVHLVMLIALGIVLLTVSSARRPAAAIRIPRNGEQPVGSVASA